MKRVNLVIITALSTMALVACGRQNPVPDNNGVNPDNGGSFWEENEQNDNGGSFWDQNTQPDNGGSFWDSEPTDSDMVDGLPSDYLNCIVGHQWARAYEGYPCEDFILDFDIEGYWKAFEYRDGNWFSVEEGFVAYNMDESAYVLFTKDDEYKYETLTYRDGVLYGPYCNYYADAQTPATAAESAEDYDPDPVYTNEDANIYYSNFNGNWLLIDPNSETQSSAYYEILNGMWDYYYYDGEDWAFGGSGYLELVDGRTDYVSFYTSEGVWLVDAFEFDDGILKCDDGSGCTLERY